MTDCGADHESCCTSLEVPGGAYYRSYTNWGNAPGIETDPATVSTFRLDKYLVTVGRFRQFVKAWKGGSGYLPPAGSGKHTHLNGGLGLANSVSPGTYEPGWLASDDSNIAPTDENLVIQPWVTWTPAPGTNESLPITQEGWYDAIAFCIWDGGFLPSEAEWGYAAAGGSQQREYPWGFAPPGTTNEYAIYGCYYPPGNACDGGISYGYAPVGIPTLGAGRWGQLDLAGEANEWTLDAYASYVTPCTDCAFLSDQGGPAMLGYWTTRGGGFSDSPYGLHSANRGYGAGDTGMEWGVGFRCARTP
jgi:formylglycine-generating enzyme required for sulfatase activity